MGVLLAVVGGLFTMTLVSRAGDRHTVVVLRNDVAEGAVLTEADLGTAKVGLDRPCAGRADESCVDVVAADHLDSLVGRVASAPLRQGALLASSQLATEGAPRPDEVISAVPISRDRLPTGIEVGDRVRIIDTGGRGEAEATILIPSARVFALEQPERLSGTVVVSIIVPAGDAAAVAEAVASDRVGLVLLTTR